MTDLESFVKILLETKYDIGTIVTLSKVKMGDTNKSFIALANKDDVLTNWYVRQYNLSEEKQDILYEHAFESYLAEKVCGEVQTILPIKTKYGTTWLHETFEGQTHYYAVFNVIKGNEPYSWEFNNLSKNAFNGCAEITAKFHAWGYGFKPPVESGRHEPSLEDQFDRWRVDFPKALKEKKQMPIFRRFTEYLEREMPYLIETTIFCSKELKKHSKSLKKCINHKDLNPGNLMFDDEDNVCAIFDMDWCNYDYRIYDIAWMGYQTIASWNTDTWGAVPLEKMQRFVNIYDNVMIERKCPLGPLTDEERDFLPTMCIIGAMKVVADFVCYEDHTRDPYRVFVNTWRFVNSIKDMRNLFEQKRKDT